MSQPTTPGQPNPPQGQPQPGASGQYPPAQQPYPQQPQQPYPQQASQQQPQQPYPQQAPQQQPQQAYPQQPYQQQAPQQQYPQPGYPQQGYPQQGYPQAQGYAPQGYPPGGGQQPPAGKSPKNLIMIVVGVVALLAIVGGVFLAMSSNRSPEPETPVTPTPVPTAPTQEPTPQETTPQETTPAPTPQETTPAPTPQQTTQAPTPPPSGSIQLTGGVVIPVAQGWQAEQKSASVAIFSDGNAQIVAQMVQTDQNADPGQVCLQFHQSVLKDAPDAQFAESAEPIDSSSNVTKIARCFAGYTETQGGQSMFVLLQTFVSVRPADASTLLFTIFQTDNTPDSSFTGINEMLNAALNSHISNA